MNALEAYRKSNELTFEALAAKAGKGTSLVWKHCNKLRIPADAVPGYESSLGIPRWMMRPDLWPCPAHQPVTAPQPEAPTGT
jgi:hypothetical protein